ncbi:MAG: TlpA disulfide reductase family protein [Candidatus Pedobacter colombiensis]|uniref:TlpA disulfide reductase family protein n=1 Tax=Candidatus Pedobacter colombiensis TaxID=3121371 RepID=A0AAJ5W6N8_9SPHI|nr:TlpA disulfide reductase family protein [Pedobacter sp.]WEK18115.1 MAG: TlpA disulfide reductase family protein [Pedobacter sp.]
MMKRNRYSILVITLLFILFQVESQAQSNKFIIKGLVDTVANATYFVTYKHNGTLIRDTISLDSRSKFKYVGTITEPTIFSLNIKNTINPLLIGDRDIYTFWVEPGKTISFEGKTGWLVQGARGLVTSPKKFHLENSEMEVTESNYKKDYLAASSAWENRMGQSLTEKERMHLADSVRTDFIHRHPDNYYSLYLLSNMLSFPKPDYALIEKMLKKLSRKVTSTYLRKETDERISVAKFIGKVMPDFVQADTLSRPVKLSSFRGKYVLVDFWASWCGPCRNENPYLVEAYKKYASQGFNILSVSLDKSKEDWLKAIHKDQLSWTHVSDLKEWDNAVAKLFFIHAIPDNFLLDPNGVIIARNLRGKELLQKLKNIFND